MRLVIVHTFRPLSVLSYKILFSFNLHWDIFQHSLLCRKLKIVSTWQRRIIFQRCWWIIRLNLTEFHTRFVREYHLVFINFEIDLKNLSINESLKYTRLSLNLMVDDSMDSGFNIFLLSKSLVPDSICTNIIALE